jgi:hypothetical protein
MLPNVGATKRSRLFLLFSSFSICVPAGPLGFLGLMYFSMFLAHRIDPETQSYGFEFIVAPIFGLVFGIAIPASLKLVSFASPTLWRFPAIILSASSIGVSCFFVGFIVMVPALAFLNSIFPSVPYLGSFDEYRSCRDNGALVSGLLGAVASLFLILSEFSGEVTG